jgi:periplasmic protein TonB
MRSVSVFLFVLFSIAFVTNVHAQQLEQTREADEYENEPVDYDAVFKSAEIPPSYPGGNEEFYKYVEKNMKYPEKAQSEKIAGTVFVSMVIQKNGKLKDIKVVKGVHEELDQEAIRLVSKSGKWLPGKVRNQPVHCEYLVPIKFKLAP